MNSDNVLLLGLKSSVTAFSKSEGRVLWKTELAGGLNNSFVTVLSDGQHVFAHSGGKLYCLDLANGQMLWSNELTGYGYGFASLCIPRGCSAPDSAVIDKIVSDRRSST
jgi:outer membrane protein assembly factor BamB